MLFSSRQSSKQGFSAGGLAGLRNGLLIVTNNPALNASPPSSAPGKGGSSSSSGASDGFARAVDAFVRGSLPPPPSSSTSSSASPLSGGAGSSSISRPGSAKEVGTSGGETDDDDDDEEDEEGEGAKEHERAVMKALAARTLEALRHLHSTQQLTREEKTVLSSDVIQSLSESRYSQVEMAYALLILGRYYITFRQ